MTEIEKFDINAVQYGIELPWPPSVNHYWRMFNGRMLISEKGRNYKKEVGYRLLTLKIPKLIGRIRISIELFPPDKRRRDIDNVAKAILDSLSPHLYDDDSQVDRLTIIRDLPKPEGSIFITIAEI